MSDRITKSQWSKSELNGSKSELARRALWAYGLSDFVFTISSRAKKFSRLWCSTRKNDQLILASLDELNGAYFFKARHQTLPWECCPRVRKIKKCILVSAQLFSSCYHDQTRAGAAGSPSFERLSSFPSEAWSQHCTSTINNTKLQQNRSMTHQVVAVGMTGHVS